MPVPDTPITREEQYYDATLRGNTSGLPTPLTRQEEYLNAIAQNGGGGGSGGGVLVVTFDDDTGVCDHTWQEIHDAIGDGQLVFWSYVEEPSYAYYNLITAAMYLNGTYYISMNFASPSDPTSALATASSANGYPTIEE